MSDARAGRRRGLAKLSLGLSILLAVAGFVYFLVRGQPVVGAGLGIALLAGGAWEYRRRMRAARWIDPAADDDPDRRQE